MGLILGLEDPLDKEMATTPISLPGKSHGERSLVVCRVARVGHYLATKPPPETVYFMKKKIMTTTHIT